MSMGTRRSNVGNRFVCAFSLSLTLAAVSLAVSGCGASDSTPRWTVADVVQQFRQATGCTLAVEFTGDQGTTLDASECGFPGSKVDVPARVMPIEKQADIYNFVDIGDGTYVGSYGTCFDPTTETETKCRPVAYGIGSELLAWTSVYDETESADNYGSSCDWASALGQALGTNVECVASSNEPLGTKTTTA